MSDSAVPAAAPPPPPRRGGLGRALLYTLVIGSFLLNIVLCGIIGFLRSQDDDLPERRLFGDKGSKDKVAVIRIDGVLFEGMTGYYVRQILQAAKDKDVKAIVLRIDSPGGTITASEELHRLITQLRDGKLRKYPNARPKKLVVSMGSVAASGGYYIAMPAETLFAERTTITGSIGVYASLPNFHGLMDRHGVKVELIKAGDIKASGSPFHELTPQERQPWQVMVDDAYDHFLDVVAAGRPNLNKAALRDEPVVREWIDLHDEKGNVVRNWIGQARKVEYVRRRADGGTFTAVEAKKLGLVDEIGDLEAAVDAVAASAGLTRYEVVVYDRPPTLLGTLLGINLRAAAMPDPARLASAATPRLWYLTPQADIAGILAAMGSEP